LSELRDLLLRLLRLRLRPLDDDETEEEEDSDRFMAGRVCVVERIDPLRARAGDEDVGELDPEDESDEWPLPELASEFSESSATWLRP
jgi:hypothetical protein